MNINSYQKRAISTAIIVVVVIIVLIVAAVAAYYAVGGPSKTTTKTTTNTSTSTSHTSTSTSHTSTSTSHTSTTSSSTTSPTYKDTIIIGTTDSVQTTIDPADAYDYFGINIIQNLGDGLVDYRPGTSQYVPALATSWSVSPDGTVWNFTLRQGVKFADGTKFNATDVKYSVDRQFAIQEAAGPFVGAGIGGTGAQCCGVINSTKVLGEYKIQFKLNYPFTAFLGMMAFATMYPVEPKLAPIPAHPDPGSNLGVINFTNNVATENPNQLGQYVLTSWQRSAGKDVEIDLTANPNYWNASAGWPKTKNIIIKMYSDLSALALALTNGEVDIAYRQLAATDVQSFETNNAFKVWEGPGTFIQYLVFNELNPVFSHQLVREAVAAAVNRTLIDNTVFLGLADPLYSMIPNGMIYHTDAFQTDYGNANVAKAKTLLTEAGYSTTNKLSITLTYPTGHYTSTDLIASAIKQSLEATGMITVTLANSQWAAYKVSTKADQFQLYLYGWYPDYLDPYDYAYPFFPADGIGFLSTNWINSTATSLITQIAGTSDTTQLATMYTQLQNIVAQAAPVVPLFQGTSVAVSNTKVSGIVLDVTTNFRYWLLQETT